MRKYTIQESIKVSFNLLGYSDRDVILMCNFLSFIHNPRRVVVVVVVLLVSTENHDLWPGPTPEVRD